MIKQIIKKLFFILLFIQVIIFSGCSGIAPDMIDMSLKAEKTVITGQKVTFDYSVKNLSEEPITEPYFLTIAYSKEKNPDRIVIAEVPVNIDAGTTSENQITWDTETVSEGVYSIFLELNEKIDTNSSYLVKEISKEINIVNTLDGIELLLAPETTKFAYGNDIKIDYGVTDNSGMELKNEEYELTLYYRERANADGSVILETTPVTFDENNNFKASFTYSVTGIPAATQEYILGLSFHPADQFLITDLAKSEVDFEFTE